MDAIVLSVGVGLVSSSVVVKGGGKLDFRVMSSIIIINFKPNQRWSSPNSKFRKNKK